MDDVADVLPQCLTCVRNAGFQMLPNGQWSDGRRVTDSMVDAFLCVVADYYDRQPTIEFDSLSIFQASAAE